MNYTLSLILLSSIVLPAGAGLVRIRQISPVFTPFILLMWLGVVNETFSQIIINLGYYNIYNYNLYSLLQSLLIVWQFKNLRLYENRNVFHWINLTLVSVFLLDNIVNGFHTFNSFFIIFRSVVIVFMTIHMINQLLTTERSNLLKHPVFLFCAAFLVFFTAIILTEFFWVYGKHLSKEFRLSMQYIFGWSNCICNIIYAFAILWMPRKLAFSLPY